MRAMVLERPGEPLALRDVEDPSPGPGQIRIRVTACAVCRTDLHVVDGELPDPGHPIIPGHEVVGVVAALGQGVDRLAPGMRVGVPWLGWTCGTCRYCLSGRENLCDKARFTGYMAGMRSYWSRTPGSCSRFRTSSTTPAPLRYCARG